MGIVGIVMIVIGIVVFGSLASWTLIPLLTFLTL